MALRMTRLVEELDPDRLRNAREDARLSGRELARRAGVHQNYISRLENGLLQEVDEDVMTRIVTALVGEGRFKGLSTEDVWRTIRGEMSFMLAPVEGEPALQVIEGEAEAREARRQARRKRNAAPDVDMCYSTHPRSDQGFRAA